MKQRLRRLPASIHAMIYQNRFGSRMPVPTTAVERGPRNDSYSGSDLSNIGPMKAVIGKLREVAIVMIRRSNCDHSRLPLKAPICGQTLVNVKLCRSAILASSPQ